MNKYNKLIDKAEYYIDEDLKIVSVLANLSAYLYYNIENLNWVGFYLFEDNELHLGPFQGKPAVVTIELDSGVCGVCATKRETIIVKDVHEFSGHIACDMDSNSEIVIPIISKSGELFGVLDIDSPLLDRFDSELEEALEIIGHLLVDIL
ncbi:GAF domain-containing protein [Mycoplasmatota bacterium WC30]